MTKRIDIIPAAVYLAAFGLCLNRIGSGFGWGGSPELAAGAALQKKVTLLGFPLLELLGRLSYALPFVESEIRLNVLSALFFGLFIVFIFYSIKELAHTTAGAAIAVAAVFFIPGLTGYFNTLTPAAWSLLLFSLLLFVASKALTADRPAHAYLFILFAGISILNSGLTAIFILLSATAIVLKKSGELLKKEFILAAAFFAVLSSIPMAYLATMDALYINFDTRLPPWLGELAPASNIASRVFNPGDAGEILFNFKTFAGVVAGPYITFFVAWLVGVIFFNRRFVGKWMIAWGLPLAAAFMLLFGSTDMREFYSQTLMLALCVSGVCGVAVIFHSTAMDPVMKKVSITVLCLALFAPATYYNYSDLSFGPDDRSKMFIEKTLLTMRRDSLLFVDPAPDHLYGVHYMRLVHNKRRDIDVLYPNHLINTSYRKYVRAAHGAGVAIPSEDDYEKILKQLSAIVPATTGGSSKHIRRRVIEGTVGMLFETTSVQNSNRRPVYFNRIDRLISSRIYPFLMFFPSDYLFRLNIYGTEAFEFSRFVELARSPLAADPVVREMTAIYFQNIGEHFFKEERYEPAVSVLEAAAGLDEENISSRFFLGIIYKQWGQYDKSELNFRQALELLLEKRSMGREHSNDIFMMSRIYNELGMREKAEKYENMVQPDQAPGSGVPGAVRQKR